jgi:2-aminobenzoate-CoA ligase
MARETNHVMAADGKAAITIQRRIEWSDTDASGRYHNTAAFRMLEFAETALLDALGMLGDVYGRLPRVHIEADFKRLLDHRDVVDIDLRVMEVGTTSVTYGVEIRRDGEVCVGARVVAVLLDGNGAPVPWGEGHRKLLLTAGRQPPERLVTG